MRAHKREDGDKGQVRVSEQVNGSGLHLLDTPFVLPLPFWSFLRKRIYMLQFNVSSRREMEVNALQRQNKDRKWRSII